MWREIRIIFDSKLETFQSFVLLRQLDLFTLCSIFYADDTAWIKLIETHVKYFETYFETLENFKIFKRFQLRIACRMIRVFCFICRFEAIRSVSDPIATCSWRASQTVRIRLIYHCLVWPSSRRSLIATEANIIFLELSRCQRYRCFYFHCHRSCALASRIPTARWSSFFRHAHPYMGMRFGRTWMINAMNLVPASLLKRQRTTKKEKKRNMSKL